MSVPSITDTRQYLTFQLGEEVFGLDVSHVKEILEFTTVTKVPCTAESMRGVINLRGSVVPVVDMSLRFGLMRTRKTVDACIIVAEVSFEEETTVLGALVDSVQEVFELKPEEIEPVPRIGTHLPTDFIKGMGKRDDRFIILLDIDKVFFFEEAATAQETEVLDKMEMAGNG